jgi:flagellar motility protein MotE (MotC chaperone)
MAEKEYKPEPPKPLKETAVLRQKLKVLRYNINTLLGQVDEMEKDIDNVEERYKKILAQPIQEVPPVPTITRPKDELDAAFDALLDG